MKPVGRSLVSSIVALQLVVSGPLAHAQTAPPAKSAPPPAAAGGPQAPPAPSAAQHAAPLTPQAKAEAEQHFKRGLELFDEDDFQGARIEFGRAYQIAPNYRVLYNLGQVNFQLQDYVKALHSFEKYLSEGGAQVPADRKEEVGREIAKLKTRVASVDVTTARDAVVSVDGVPVGTAPLAGPIQVSAGRRVVRATLPGREPVEKVLELAGGDSLKIELAGLAPKEATETPTTPPPAASEPEPSKSPPWLLWGLTGALVAGTAVTGILALSASSSANGIKTNGGSFSDYQDDQQRMRTFAVTTDIVGAAAIVVGAVAIYFTVAAGGHNTKSARAGSTTRPSQPAIGSRGGVLSLSF